MITNEFINRAIDYILGHINEAISVEEIADHCNFSRHYFSRMFKIETGEGIYEFIKRVKMEQSAFRLKVERGRSITSVGQDYGFSSSNYSTSFRQHHSISPIEFRRTILEKSRVNPIFGVATGGLETFDQCSAKVTIETLPDTPVIFERHKGNYGDLSAHWGAFLEKYAAYQTEGTLLMERTYDDPTITGVDQCLYDLCLTAPAGCTLKNTYIIEGGKFAVYHFKGPVAQIYAAYQNLFSVWLPHSGCRMDDRYGFEIYRYIDCDAMEMGIDLCIPIE